MESIKATLSLLANTSIIGNNNHGWVIELQCVPVLVKLASKETGTHAGKKMQQTWTNTLYFLFRIKIAKWQSGTRNACNLSGVTTVTSLLCISSWKRFVMWLDAACKNQNTDPKRPLILNCMYKLALWRSLLVDLSLTFFLLFFFF